MPIQPIGIKNRKGALGSPYAISDYVSVNSELGTLDDLKLLVNKAHQMGFYVILDWVANHTAWDHIWIDQHPDFYTKNSNGDIVHPENTDWHDVADLNFYNQNLRHEMIESLKYWVREADFDGFRCDMAGLVPTDFWEAARIELDKLKPVFMLAEAEQLEMHFKAFDMTYNWACHHLMNDIAKGAKSVGDLDAYFGTDPIYFPKNAIRLNFTSNHDENKNAGSAVERFGNSYKAFIVLTFTMPGSPLIFSGQEAGLNRRLQFFDKDEIDWASTLEYTPFFQSMVKLKKENPALWTGEHGGYMNRLYTNKIDKIFAFSRCKSDNMVVVVLNLSPERQSFYLDINLGENNLKSFFTGEPIISNILELPPWGYNILLKGN
jgi:glycosidase